MFAEDQLKTPGRPIIDEAFLDDFGVLRRKGRRCVPRGEVLNFLEMGGGLLPALCSTMEMIVNEEKGCSVGKVSVPARLVL